MTRVAVVDLGTNSTRLLIADLEGRALREVDRRLTITKLGENVDAGRRLQPAAIARVETCLSEYAAVVEAAGAQERLAFATSAVRDALNGREFLARVEATFGFETRLLNGSQEALLTFRGVSSGRCLPDLTVVVDLGGGSTELIIGQEETVAFHTSLDVGCVRLTERYLASDPPTAVEVERLREEVRSLLGTHVAETVRPTRGIGVAGTVTTLGTLRLGLPEEDPERLHGELLPAEWIETEAARLASTPTAELIGARGLSPGRAPVIAAGALALAEIVAFFGLAGLEVSERDILHGAALDLVR